MSALSSIKFLLQHFTESWRNAKAVTELSGRARFSMGLPRLIEGVQHISIEKESSIREGAWLGAFPELAPRKTDRPFRVVIREKVYIGFFATLTAVDLVEIQSGTMISDGFYASDHSHDFNPKHGAPSAHTLESKGPVIIGKNCFIGMRVSVLAGVTLGDHCVVGAHSVVTRSFPAYSMIGGSPAKLIKVFDAQAGEWKPANPQSSSLGAPKSDGGGSSS